MQATDMRKLSRNARHERRVQVIRLRKLITDKTPDQSKMPYALWTRGAVSQLIEQRFGIRLPVRTMGPYLARWGFTPQEPMKKAAVVPLLQAARRAACGEAGIERLFTGQTTA